MRYITIIVLLFSFFQMRCIKDKSTPAISAFLSKELYYDGDSSFTRDVLVYNYKGFSIIPAVTLNGETLGISDWRIDWYQYSDENPVSTNTEYELKVSHSDGTAEAKIAMPANFTIVNPDTNYILGRESTLVIVWQKSTKASWYWLDLYLSYEYTDTSGEWDSYDFWKDTVITDTFCQFRASRFFPAYVLNIIEGEAEANVWAMDGPKIYPGSEGNITGDGIGFFNAANETQDAYFYVGYRPPVRNLYHKNISRAKLKDKLKLLAPIH